MLVMCVTSVLTVRSILAPVSATASASGSCVTRWVAAWPTLLPACYTTFTTGVMTPLTASATADLTHIIGLQAMAQQIHITHIDPAATHERITCHITRYAGSALVSGYMEIQNKYDYFLPIS